MDDNIFMQNVSERLDAIEERLSNGGQKPNKGWSVALLALIFVVLVQAGTLLYGYATTTEKVAQHEKMFVYWQKHPQAEKEQSEQILSQVDRKLDRRLDDMPQTMANIEKTLARIDERLQAQNKRLMRIEDQK